MAQEQFLTYKGYPLVRKDKTIYFGNPYDQFVIMMQIASVKEVNGIEIADKILIQLINTDPDLRPKDKLVKKGDRKGLYAAMDLAYIWLDRANNPKK